LNEEHPFLDPIDSAFLTEEGMKGIVDGDETNFMSIIWMLCP